MTDPVMSVIVMGYRNRDNAVAAVESVMSQRSSHLFEVIFVTSGGDDSAELVRRAFPGLPVIESSERLMPGAARNRGMDQANGKFVAFLAADCIAEEDWVETRAKRHLEGKAAVSSAVTPSSASTVGVASYLVSFGSRMPGRRAGVVTYPDGAIHGASFDRALLQEMGGFDGSLRVGEDTSLLRDIEERGESIWFEPAVRTMHLSPEGFREALSAHRRRGVLREAHEGGDRRRPKRSPLLRAFRKYRYVLRMARSAGTRPTAAVRAMVAILALAEQAGRLAGRPGDSAVRADPAASKRFGKDPLSVAVGLLRAVVPRRLQPEVVLRGNHPRAVALTFDDCNDPFAWRALLEELNGLGVQAAFFPSGSVVADFQEVLAEAAQLGHLIGSHGWDHERLTDQSFLGVWLRIRRDARLARSVTGRSTAPYFRPPFRAYDRSVLLGATLARHTRIVLWDVDPQDWRRPGTDHLVTSVVDEAGPGSVIVFHVLGETVDAVRGIVEGLRHKGLSIERLDRVLESSR